MAKGSVQKLGKKRYRVRLPLGHDTDGKRLEFSKVVSGTKAEAESLLDEKKRELYLTGGVIVSSDQLLSDHLKVWKDTVLPYRVEETTADSYWRIINRHIIPQLGHVPLNKLTPEMIHTRYVEAQEESLSGKTALYLHGIFKMAMDYAVKWKKLLNNPVDHVDAPKASEKERKAFTQEEAVLLLKKSEGSRYKILLETLFATGLRPSEAYALNWTDIDLEKSTLSVRRSIKRPRGKKWSFGPPKTKKSRRSMPIPEGLVAGLKKLKVRTAKEIMAAREKGMPYTDHGLVFCQKNGEPIKHDSFAKNYFRPLLKKAGLDGRGFVPYCTRHTCATLLLKAGINPKIVSERLGHASIVITMDRYSHCLPDMQNEASEKLNEMLY